MNLTHFAHISSILSKSNMPILPSFQPGNLKNTSRHELFVSEIITKKHKQLFPGHRILSLCNGDGYQKTVEGNLSSDIFCEDCNVAIFVEGYFKYDCSLHKDEHLSERKILLNKLGLLKRATFCKKVNIKKCFILPTCCIERGEYTQDFMESAFFDIKLTENAENKIKCFPINHYQKLNFQDAILSPFNFPLVKAFKCYKDCILKFDIESAYISVFEDPEFILPSSNKATIFVGEDANNYVKQVDLTKTFCVVRIFILPKDDLEFQVFPLKVNRTSTFSFYCKSCSKDGKPPKPCFIHSNEQKGVHITCYGRDIVFFDSLNYKYKATEVISFPATHNSDIEKYFKNFREFKSRSICNLEKTISKRAALATLGRCAFNIQKHESGEKKFSTNANEIRFFFEQNKKINFSVFKSSILWTLKERKKHTNFKDYLKSCSFNTCSILYGAANNEIR